MKITQELLLRIIKEKCGMNIDTQPDDYTAKDIVDSFQEWLDQFIGEDLNKLYSEIKS